MPSLETKPCKACDAALRGEPESARRTCRRARLSTRAAFSPAGPAPTTTASKTLSPAIPPPPIGGGAYATDRNVGNRVTTDPGQVRTRRQLRCRSEGPAGTPGLHSHQASRGALSAGEGEMGDAVGRADGLNVEALLEFLEPVPKAFAACENDGHDRDVHVVDQVGREELANCGRSSANPDV